MDGFGNLYFADLTNNRIREVTPDGTIHTVAGTGTAGYNGDNIPATSAELNAPTRVVSDAAGNYYIADEANNRVRKVTPDGTITTVAGGGTGCALQTDTLGDGCPATSAVLYRPADVAFDGAGNLYIADAFNGRIREVTPGGTITTVAGGGMSFPGDGGPATSAQLLQPTGLAFDSAGNLYIADADSGLIREVTPAGIITTVAGNGTQGYNGDNLAATSAELFVPSGVAVDVAGNLYIADLGNGRVRKVTPDGTITTVAGGGPGCAQQTDSIGDGCPAVNAALSPVGVALDALGNLYIADGGPIHRIRKVDVSDPPSLTFASTNVGAASAAQDVTALNLGNAPLTVSQISTTSGFALQGPDTSCSASSQTLAPAASCVLGIEFTPTENGSMSGNVVLTDNALNASDTTQTIALQGTATQGTQTISFTVPASPVTYGVAPITLSATASSGLPVTFSIVSGPGTLSGNTLTITGMGTVVVAVDQVGNANYAAAPEVQQGIVVNPAPLTVTANNVAVALGAPIPAFAYTITGFVNGDSSAVVSGTASLATTATTSSPVGAYPITFSAESLMASDYTFTYVGGVLELYNTSLVQYPTTALTWGRQVIGVSNWCRLALAC